MVYTRPPGIWKCGEYILEKPKESLSFESERFIRPLYDTYNITSRSKI